MYLLKYDELGLKSRKSQKRLFQKLFQNIEKVGGWAYFKEGRLFAEGDKYKLARIFGITQVWDVIESEKSLESIVNAIEKHAGNKTYKIEVKRVDKQFPGTSLDITKSLVQNLSIPLGVKTYDEIIHVEIRHGKALILMNPVDGPGGLPYGTQGNVLMMFSGGIDSPVASWMLARRGAKINYLYFSTCKCMHKDVINVYNFLKNEWYIEGDLYFVDGSETIKQILTKIPRRYRMVVFKRVLYKVAEKAAKMSNSLFLATGESLGQVSTQTLGNLSVIDNATPMGVLRPLIGFNKQEIINKAKEIGSYSKSIEVEERCTIAPNRVSVNAPLEKIISLERDIYIPEPTKSYQTCNI